MTTPISGENVPRERPTTTIQIGRFKLTGASALIALVIIVALIVALIVHMRPSAGMLLSGGLWIVFLIYWSVAAKNAGATKNSESVKSRQKHQLMLNVALLLLFIPVPGLTRRYLPAEPVLVPIGLTVQAAFFLLAIWARRHLGRNWSGAVTITEEHQLVRSGPYRLIRHPIYTAMFGMFIGTALVSGEIHALLAVALLIFAYWRKIPLEEQTLREHFGDAFESYRRKTWALLPGLF